MMIAIGSARRCEFLSLVISCRDHLCLVAAARVCDRELACEGLGLCPISPKGGSLAGQF